jgi:hypothetical protein
MRVAGALCAALWVTAWPGFAASIGRQEAIAQAAKSIEQECQRDAGGDWQKWYEQLAAFREELNPIIAREWEKQRTGVVKTGILKAAGSPPLFVECLSGGYLSLWGVPTGWEEWLKARSSPSIIATVKDWLKQRNIDLIFVPAPKMAEVYPDRVVGHVPPDRIVAPHMRKMLLDLLRADVEVVDLLPAFLKAREQDPEPLFLPSDTHWSDRAQRIAAQDIAARLERYPFVKAALAKPALYKTDEIARVPFQGSLWGELTEAERQEIGEAVNTPVVRVRKASDGAPVAPVDESSIVIMGDSYTNQSLGVAPGSGISAQIAKGANQPVTIVSSAGGTTEPVKDLIRNPDLLDKVKVVIWIVKNPGFTNPWTPLPALPARGGGGK